MLAKLLPEEIVLIVLLVPVGGYTIYSLIKEYISYRRLKKLKKEVRGDDADYSLRKMQNERLQGTNQKENQE